MIGVFVLGFVFGGATMALFVAYTAEREKASEYYKEGEDN